jgi:histidinol phosphate phosphatase hisN-like protein
MLGGRVAGPVTSHDRQNVRWKIDRLVEGDPNMQFGLTGLTSYGPDEVLSLMAEAAGFDADPQLFEGPTAVDPWRVLWSLEAAGRRLALAADRGERILMATGHPAGLLLLYMAVADLVERHGAELLMPHEGPKHWREAGRRREIRFFHGVGVLTDRASALHTHDPGAMFRMLQEGPVPDLAFTDHGFAGAAIESGVETVTIADVNDPAPVLAMDQGRTEIVIVMDDNVRPDSYWPCFQAIASQFPM